MHSSNVWDMIFGWNLQERYGGLEYGGASYRQNASWFVTGPMSVFLGISLFPGALIGVLALARRSAFSQGLLWLAWLAVGVVAFGLTSVKLASYWASVTPAIAALSGIGLAYLVENRGRLGWVRWAALALAAFGFAYHAYAFWRVQEVAGYFLLSAFVAAVMVVGIIAFPDAFVAPDAEPDQRKRRGRASWSVPAVAVVAIIVLNGQIAVHNILRTRTDTLGRIGFDMIAVPSAQPAGDVTSTRGRLQGAVITSIVRVDPMDLDAALKYVAERRGDSRYLLAADTYNTSARVLLLTGEPVLTLFSEYQDVRITEITALRSLVASGDVRYVLTSPLMRYMDFELFSWLLGHARADISRQVGLPTSEMLLQVAE